MFIRKKELKNLQARIKFLEDQMSHCMKALDNNYELINRLASELGIYTFSKHSFNYERASLKSKTIIFETNSSIWVKDKDEKN